MNLTPAENCNLAEIRRKQRAAMLHPTMRSAEERNVWLGKRETAIAKSKRVPVRKRRTLADALERDAKILSVDFGK